MRKMTERRPRGGGAAGNDDRCSDWTPDIYPAAPLLASKIAPERRVAEDRIVRVIAMKFGLSLSLAGTVCCLAGFGRDGATEHWK
jgi:hypothetical protein